MEFAGSTQGSESQDSDEPAPPGTRGFEDARQATPSTSSPHLKSFKGIENAKKRLRAFSIQKKTPIPPVSVVKPVSTGNTTTVMIGKLSSVKATPKVEKPDDEQKKLPKPPKPGARQKLYNESYTELQKKTLAEIEDMKRKMELVELGIPLGLVCPSTNAIPVKAMPTKAMPPIKTFLDTEKIDAIIREAKKAKAEGKEFKFDYQKFVPDYDNPFQRKKDSEADKGGEKKEDEHRRIKSDKDKDRDKDRRKSERYDRRHDYWKDDRDKFRDKGKFRERERKDENRSRDRDDKSKETVKERDDKSRDRDARSKERDMKSKDRDKDDRSKDREKYKIKDVKSKEPLRERDEKGKYKDKDDKVKKGRAEVVVKEDKSKKDVESSSEQDKDGKETDVNLNDYLVCDSWSLDTDEKNISSPQVEDKTKTTTSKSFTDPLENLRQNIAKKDSNKPVDSPKTKEKLRPVLDSFKFELDPNDDDDTMLDIFDEDSDLERYSMTIPSKKDLYDSPGQMKFGFDRESKDTSNDGMNDDTFLESVINELKQENMSDDEHHDKALVEYDESPEKSSQEPSLGSVTPELDDSIRLQSQRSDYSDGYRSTDSRKSTESGYKSTESGFRSTESGYKPAESGYELIESEKSKNSRSMKDFRLSIEKESDEAFDSRMSKDVVDSLETWSFVLKICQPLLFRHDKNKCYKETRSMPKVWYTQNPKLCSCVKDRSVVYEELEMCKMNLVDRVYGCDQIPDAPYQVARTWYPQIEQCLVENPHKPVDLITEWDIEERRPEKPVKQRQAMTLDREYQRFMEAVEGWPDAEAKEDSRSTTPVRQESRKKKAEDKESKEEKKKKAKKIKLSSGGWSQESDVEEDKVKPLKPEKVKRKRKRKHSSSISSESISDEVSKKRKKVVKEKDGKKVKSKAKRRRLEKKMAKKLKEKKKKKKSEKIEEESDLEDEEKVIKKKDKKLKKKKQQKLKKKIEKKKKERRARSSSSSSSSSSSDSSSDTDSESDRKARKKKKKEAEARKKKEKKKKSKQQSASDSTQSEELFDVNILNNIKTERVTDDEKRDKSPVKHREIISVKELQEEFSSNVQVANVQIKQEVEEAKNVEAMNLETKNSEVRNLEAKSSEAKHSEVKNLEEKNLEAKNLEATNLEAKNSEAQILEAKILEAIELPKEPEPEVIPVVSETEAELMDKFDLNVNLEEEQFSVTEEKIETVMFKEPEIPTPPPRPDESSQCSSQESICSIKEHSYEKDESHLRPSSQNSNYSFNDVMASQAAYKPMEDNLEGYENYDMYEQMAMAYQSDVASQQVSPPSSSVSQRIETVVRARGRGEIKCDWRASDPPTTAQHTRPSRWGLKPGEVNIVLTGEGSECPTEPEPPPAPQPVYKIQSLANRTDSSIGYDEAYMDMYGAADRLQYGDCFSAAPSSHATQSTQSTQESRARSLDDRINQALRDTVLGDVAKDETEKDVPEKGILVMKSLSDSKAAKRVSFADGYKPGQDSDVEEPPVKKRQPRRVGCAWPCPTSHPDHVPLWDALPPPPPPPGDPPPPRHVMRDLSMSIPNFRPPEPPPGLLNFA